MKRDTITTHDKTACNAAEDAKRYYLATKALTEDSLEHRKRAAKSALDARHEACSAMYCVIWCVIGTVLSICGAIFSLLK